MSGVDVYVHTHLQLRRANETIIMYGTHLPQQIITTRVMMHTRIRRSAPGAALDSHQLSVAYHSFITSYDARKLLI